MTELNLGEAFRLGIEAHRAGKLEEADRYYTAILKAQPKHPDANHNMGVLAVSVGKIEQAIPFFKAALGADPTITQYWLSIIDAFIKLSKKSDAKSFIDQARRQGHQGDAIDKLELGLSSQVEELSQKNIQSLINLYNQGDYDRALLEIDRLVDIYPDAVILHNIAGASQAALGQYEAAIETYKKALELQPDNAEVYYNMGIASKSKGDFDAAVESYKQVLKIRPDYSEAHNNMGNALSDKGDVEAAIESYKKAIKLKPDYADAYYNYGQCLLKINDLANATKAYQELLKLRPTDEKVCYNLAHIFREQNDVDAAIESYKQAIKLKPDYADAFNNIGVCLSRRGELDAANDYFEKALKFKPSLVEAQKNIANVLRDKGDVEAAIESYKKAIKLKPDYVEALNNIGACQSQKGDVDAAIESYKKAIKLKPDYADPHNNIGDCYYKTGNIDAALESYKKAIELRPDYGEAWDNIFFVIKAKSQFFCDPFVSLAKENFIFKAVLDFKLSRGQEVVWEHFQTVKDILSDSMEARNISELGRSFDSGLDELIKSKVVALVHFGRSGTGLLHSLIDDHPQVSTLPSIYFSELFNLDLWKRISNGESSKIIENFASIFDVLFDASAKTPIPTKSHQSISDIGFKEGMLSLGEKKNEVLGCDKDIFCKELSRLLNSQNEINLLTFFYLIHSAYNKTIGDVREKKLIFYHIHNPDLSTQINFSRLIPETNWLLMVREPIQSCESWIRTDFDQNDYDKISMKIVTMLLEIDNIFYLNKSSKGIRLEDLKNNPEGTIASLCNWMGIDHNDSLYRMTAQGKRWWGDPTSPSYASDGMNPFGKEPLKQRLGTIFSQRDQFIFDTVFYPFKVSYGYTEANFKKFKEDLVHIRPLIDDLFDFEKTIIMRTKSNKEQFIKTGPFLYLRSVLIERWNILNEFGTYPNLIEPLEIKEE